MHIDDNKKWENLTISNDFLFSKLMRDEEICKELIELLLHLKVGEITYIQEQKTIDIMHNQKSVRLDVYVEDEDKVYNIEMQVSNKKDLDKRVRYYQDLIDINILEKGADYKDLKESYVVCICLFDPFGRGGSRYTFRNRCDEYPDLVLKDDTYKIFFNTKNTQNEKNIDVKSFLQYVNGEKVNNKFIEKIHNKIMKIKNNEEWRREYMTLLMREREIAEENFQKGIEKGIEKGMITKQIEMLKRFNVPKEDIIKEIEADYNITKEEIEKYL